MPPTPLTIDKPNSDSWMFLDLKTTATTRPTTKKITKKIASPLTPNWIQLILDQEELERMNQMDLGGFGCSTLNSSWQSGHETKSPAASTSSLDLQRGHRIFTPKVQTWLKLTQEIFNGSQRWLYPPDDRPTK